MFHSLRTLMRYLMVLTLIVKSLGQISAPPRNTAVAQGTRVMLQCQTVGNHYTTILWTRGSPAEIIAFGCAVNTEYVGHFQTEIPTQFSCNLIIVNVIMDDMNLYSCVTFNPSLTAIAELIVLEQPTIRGSRNFTYDYANPGDYIEMTCSYNYRSTGSILPSIEWTPLRQATFQRTETSIVSTTVIQTTTGNVPQQICTFMYTEGINTPERDPNPPAFQSSYNFQQIPVIPPLDCGAILHPDSDNQVPSVPDGWTMCYYQDADFENNPQYLFSNCSQLVNGIRDYRNSAGLLAAGGTFGCAVSRELNSDITSTACTGNYQHNLIFGNHPCSSCKIMAVCLRYPANG